MYMRECNRLPDAALLVDVFEKDTFREPATLFFLVDSELFNKSELNPSSLNQTVNDLKQISQLFRRF